MTEDIEALVEQLRALHVRKARLLDEERQLVDRLVAGVSQHAAPDSAGSLPSTAPVVRTASSGGQYAERQFTTGDWVYITNKLGALAPLGRKATLKDRAAVVIGALGERMYFKTLRGKESWRVDNNLRALSTREKEMLGIQHE